MTWKLEYLPEAITYLASLDNSIRQPVIKGIRKVQKNPVSKIIFNFYFDVLFICLLFHSGAVYGFLYVQFLK